MNSAHWKNLTFSRSTCVAILTVAAGKGVVVRKLQVPHMLSVLPIPVDVEDLGIFCSTTSRVFRFFGCYASLPMSIPRPSTSFLSAQTVFSSITVPAAVLVPSSRYSRVPCPPPCDKPEDSTIQEVCVNPVCLHTVATPNPWRVS